MALTGATLGALSLTTPDSNGVQWFLGAYEGWGAPAGSIAPVLKPRQAGGWAGLSYAKPRSIVLKGSTVVPSEALALAAVDALVAAASLDETVLTIIESGSPRSATVRRDGDVLVTWAVGSGFSFDWSVQVVALDPRKFGAALTASTGLPASSGGLTVPFTVPFTIASTVVSGQVSLVNPGNASGPVTLRIDGPVTGPVITHVGTGLQLIFSASLTLAAGEWLTVSMEGKTAMANDQANRANWITSRGWSEFDPGPNTWAFTAPSFSAGARLTVTAVPSWM